MEHKIILGGEAYLPFALSRIKALRATGLKYASQRFIMPGGETVRVQIVGEHEYIELRGGAEVWSIGIENNRITVRSSAIDTAGAWRVHSQFDYAYSDPLDIVPFVKLSSSRFQTFSIRSADIVGSDSSSAIVYSSDGFGKGVPIYSGPATPYLAGVHWGGHPAWIISTDGISPAGAYVLSAVDLTGSGTEDFRNIIWKCEHVDFKSTTLTAKPTMWAFTYDPTTHSTPPDRQLHTLPTENVVYVGGGKFVYGLGGSSYRNGTRDADHKMVIIVTQDFETFVAYDVETALGGVYGTEVSVGGYGDFSLGGCCYIGNGLVLFGGYGTTDMIVFNSATGAMTRRFTANPAVPWLTTRPVPMSVGDDSACYWEYDPGATALNDAIAFTYTTDQGVSWTVPTMSFVDKNGDPVTIQYYLGTTTVRRPLVKDGATITSNGELGAVFHVAGEGHYEFRTTNLGATWVKHGLISATAATTTVGLIFRHVLYGDPKISLMWG